MHSLIDFIKNLYDPVYMQGLIHAGGVPLAAAIVFAETGLLVGFFLPGDTMLFIAGVAAAAKWIDIWALIPALIAAAVTLGACSQGDDHGSVQKATGHIESAAGDLTGSDKLKGQGKHDEVVGGMKSAVGDVKDTVKDAVKK